MSLMVLAISVLTLLSGCGSSSSSSSDDSATAPQRAPGLRGVFYRTLEIAPAISITLQRANGDYINKSTAVSIDERVDTSIGNTVFGPIKNLSTDTSGFTSTVLPVGAYPLYISRVTGTTGKQVVGSLNDTLTVTQDDEIVYQAAQQNWTIKSASTMTQVDISIYQCDAAGVLNWGTDARQLDPSAFFLSTLLTSTVTTTTTTMSTELFKGYYRAVIVAKGSGLAPYITPASSRIYSPGEGVVNNINVNLTSGGNQISLSLKEDTTTTVISSPASYTLSVYDKSSLMFIGSVGFNAQGVATVLTGNISDVVAVVEKNNGSYNTNEAVLSYTATPTMTAILTKYNVGGAVKPSTGTLSSSDADIFVLASASATGDAYEKILGTADTMAAPAIVSSGSYTIKLFEGSYTLSAVNVDGFPDSAKRVVNVTTSLTGQDISVTKGGVITGRIRHEDETNLANLWVYVRDAQPINGTYSNLTSTQTTSMGVYSIAVPYGTYDLQAGGGITRGLVVSASTPTVTQNLTRFRVEGRVTDSRGRSVDNANVSSSGSGDTADASGAYRLDLMQGENYIWFAPPDDRLSLGFTYEKQVQIDASTITTN